MKEQREMPRWIQERFEPEESAIKIVTLNAGETYLVHENVKRFEEGKKDNELVVPVIMGPSGSGKDTLVEALDSSRFARVKTFTTRPKGRNETEENDVYVRGTREDFERMYAEGRFLEHTDYDGNIYGMIRDIVEDCLEMGKIPVFRVDLNGVKMLRQLKEQGEPLFKDMNFWVIFTCPPDQLEWMKRIVKRDVMSKNGSERKSMRAKTKKRWRQALSDLEWMCEADEILVNYDGEERIKEMANEVKWRIDWWNS
jgi:guanylate kinase